MSGLDFDLVSLAAYLHLTPQQVERLASRGEILGRKVGGTWRFSHADVHHWMEARMGVLDETELELVERRLQQECAVGWVPTLAELLPPACLAVPLQARTKASVITEMVELASQSGWLWDKQEMVEAVRYREELCSTALENGVALLHPRRPMGSILAQPILSLGITSQGIPFGGGRGLTDIFFLICSTDDRGHLQTLARISRLIAQQGLLDRLRQARDTVSVRDILLEADAALMEPKS